MVSSPIGTTTELTQSTLFVIPSRGQRSLSSKPQYSWNETIVTYMSSENNGITSMSSSFTISQTA